VTTTDYSTAAVVDVTATLLDDPASGPEATAMDLTVEEVFPFEVKDKKEISGLGGPANANEEIGLVLAGKEIRHHRGATAATGNTEIG
jgi:hypothetical protein